MKANKKITKGLAALFAEAPHLKKKFGYAMKGMMVKEYDGGGYMKPKYNEGGTLVGDPNTDSRKRLKELESQIESLKASMREEKTDEGMQQLSDLRKEYKQLRSDIFMDTQRDLRMSRMDSNPTSTFEDVFKIFEQKKSREENLAR